MTQEEWQIVKGLINAAKKKKRGKGKININYI